MNNISGKDDNEVLAEKLSNMAETMNDNPAAKNMVEKLALIQKSRTTKELTDDEKVKLKWILSKNKNTNTFNYFIWIALLFTLLFTIYASYFVFINFETLLPYIVSTIAVLWLAFILGKISKSLWSLAWSILLAYLIYIEYIPLMSLWFWWKFVDYVLTYLLSLLVWFSAVAAVFIGWTMVIQWIWLIKSQLSKKKRIK